MAQPRRPGTFRGRPHGAVDAVAAASMAAGRSTSPSRRAATCPGALFLHCAPLTASVALHFDPCRRAHRSLVSRIMEEGADEQDLLTGLHVGVAEWTLAGPDAAAPSQQQQGPGAPPPSAPPDRLALRFRKLSIQPSPGVAHDPARLARWLALLRPHNPTMVSRRRRGMPASQCALWECCGPHDPTRVGVVVAVCHVNTTRGAAVLQPAQERVTQSGTRAIPC